MAARAGNGMALAAASAVAPHTSRRRVSELAPALIKSGLVKSVIASIRQREPASTILHDVSLTMPCLHGGNFVASVARALDPVGLDDAGMDHLGMQRQQHQLGIKTGVRFERDIDAALDRKCQLLAVRASERVGADHTVADDLGCAPVRP